MIEKQTVYLDRNEYNYGPAPEVEKVLRNFDPDKLCFYTRIYDEGKKSILSDYIAELYDIPEKQVILGYGGEDILKQELNCSLKKLELTNQLGFDLKKEQLDALSSNGVYTGEMFGEALLKDERYVDHELLKPYRSGGSRSDNPYVNFYWDYYAQGKPCYTKV